jgi:glycosyltransferase involved in cell wall biosynthesis
MSERPTAGATSEQPTVSVVTPSYNQSEYIRDTIESVRMQSYDEVNHVVVDGESDDGTLDILREYDDDIEWVSEPDEGQSDAINKGFDMVEGDIVGWLNSDDVYFDTGTLRRIVSYFDRYDADVIYGDMALLDAASNIKKIHTVPDFDYKKLLRYCFIEQPALFFRSTTLEEQRLDTDLSYVMDYEFWLRLAQDHKFRHVDDILAGDRNHDQRKILKDRQAMQAEGREMTRAYGATEQGTLPHRIERANDILTSGIPRRLRALEKTIDLHRDPPQLAFDGNLSPRGQMLKNVFRANRNIL